MTNKINNYAEQINAIAAFIRSNNIVLTDENSDQVMKDFMTASMKLNQNIKTLSVRQAMIATGI